MENNNTHRKARIYYKGESIPVLVVGEDANFYLLILDWNDPELYTAGAMQQESVRNLYMEAIWGYEGAGKDFLNTDTGLEVCSLHKEEPNIVLVFDESEPEEAQGEPTEMSEPDNVVPFPKVAELTELNQHLVLLARSGYKVKSFDLNIQENGEAHLCATFTKEVDN